VRSASAAAVEGRSAGLGGSGVGSAGGESWRRERGAAAAAGVRALLLAIRGHGRRVGLERLAARSYPQTTSRLW